MKIKWPSCISLELYWIPKVRWIFAAIYGSKGVFLPVPVLFDKCPINAATADIWTVSFNFAKISCERWPAKLQYFGKKQKEAKSCRVSRCAASWPESSTVGPQYSAVHWVVPCNEGLGRCSASHVCILKRKDAKILMADITQIFYELSVMADILVKKSFQFFHSCEKFCWLTNFIVGLPARDI